MTKQRTMTKDERFFWKHAGYNWQSTPKCDKCGALNEIGAGCTHASCGGLFVAETKAQGRRRCAIALADAEAFAQAANWICDWRGEDDPDLSFMPDEERAKDHEVVCCQLRDEDGTVLESLGNIVDADRNYVRVVEAELALEAMTRIGRETATRAQSVMHMCDSSDGRL